MFSYSPVRLVAPGELNVVEEAFDDERESCCRGDGEGKECEGRRGGEEDGMMGKREGSVRAIYLLR